MFSLETERLVIRDWMFKDVDEAQKYASDPEVSKYMDWGPNSIRETKDFIREAISSAKEKPRRAYELSIEYKLVNKVIGGIGLSIKDLSYSTAMLGYALNKDYWSKGIVSEASKEMLRFAFSDLDLHRVYATTDSKNLGSQRVLEKCGFRKEGHMVEDINVKGAWRDTFLYAILKREWKQIHGVY